MKLSFLITAILSVIVPSSAYGQTTVRNSTATPNQCLDFNGDGICEYIVLTNGTQVANPLPISEVQNQTNQTDGYKLWERWLDGVRYTDIHEYNQALDAKGERDWEETEDSDDNNDNDNDNDDERNDNIGEGLPQEGGCQEHDDYCDADEGCRSESVDCIDDRGFDEDDYDG